MQFISKVLKKFFYLRLITFEAYAVWVQSKLSKKPYSKTLCIYLGAARFQSFSQIA